MTTIVITTNTSVSTPNNNNEPSKILANNNDEVHSLDKMKTSKQENDQMSVGELRQWLSQFGDTQKDHYIKGQIQKLAQNYIIQKRKQAEESRLCMDTTSESATSPNDLPPKTTEPTASDHDSSRLALTPKPTEPKALTLKAAEPNISYQGSTQLTLSPETTEPMVLYHDSAQPTLPLKMTAPTPLYHDSAQPALTLKKTEPTSLYHDSAQPTSTLKKTEPTRSYQDSNQLVPPPIFRTFKNDENGSHANAPLLTMMPLPTSLYQASAQPALTLKKTEPKRLYHDSIQLASSPIFRSFKNDENGNHADDPPLSLGSKDLENYRIVSIQKLLEPPEPQPRRGSFSSSCWDDFDDDFSEPKWNHSWHPNARRSLVDDWADHEDEAIDTLSLVSESFTDPGTHSLSRQVTRRFKSSKMQDETKKQKPVGMFRRKLPLLLCKSVKDTPPKTSLSARPPTLIEMAAASTETCLSARPSTLFEMAAASTGEPLPAAPPKVTETTSRSESPPTTHMYNASLFQGKTLTSSTLDLLCGNSPVDRSKYQHTSISEGETVSTWSEDSRQPSIAPGAIGARLGDVFAEEIELENEKIMSARAETRQATRSLAGNDEPRLEHPLVATKLQGHTSGYSTTAHNSDSVTSVVQRFGGAARKTAIQRRTEELEKKWAADRASSRVSKIKWQVCQRTGAYKKQYVLD
jgi:hypothetical protein